MTRLALVLASLSLGCAAGSSTPSTPAGSATAAATLITNASLIDGTGAPARAASVRIAGDRIVAVGALAVEATDRVIDARGRVLAPGFIDTHSHADGGLDAHPDALAAVSQGITTVIVGQDGHSPFPLAAFFARRDSVPTSLNVASYVGHGALREHVMGADFRRVATAAEVNRMRELVASEMRSGALGLSTGLEYDPGIYSDRAEVMALAREAAAAGGRYISHIRSEDRTFWQAVEELIAIGRQTGMPVQISHAKLAMRSLWGQSGRLIAMLDSARATGVRVTADVYPYLYWQSTLTVLFPARKFDDRAEAEFALTELSTPAGLLLGRYAPDTSYSGKTVAEISRLRGTDSVTTLIDLIRDAEQWSARTGRSAESVIATSMIEPDLEKLLAWPFANVCTDGELAGRHPRGYGSFPRVLGRYVRERGVMQLEEAIRKMTSLPASNVGIRERGAIAPGMFADLVLLDAARVIDRATPQEPQRASEGIETVWVNGEIVYDAGRTTARRPGRALRRAP